MIRILPQCINITINITCSGERDPGEAGDIGDNGDFKVSSIGISLVIRSGVESCPLGSMSIGDWSGVDRCIGFGLNLCCCIMSFGHTL